MQRTDPATRFLAAVGHAAAAQLGQDHPLAMAAREAAKTGAPGQGARVHELLAGLDDAARDRILAAAHREMREDIAAVWGLLPGAAQSGGMH
ncbi:hypothetical protein [Pseudogemmobacter humi]|uniref:Uncharacterized protein n=1 Tax=Pseudogemmobacter humi TaxID=2483812 RepID=A0A3P5XC95_9RHOB|nr:hypothetical protein [Pseudogemmobacter humi]VDC32268.1 hypothetical protein XINFAN_03350 [Pseudogemmobacter humi]